MENTNRGMHGDSLPMLSPLGLSNRKPLPLGMGCITCHTSNIKKYAEGNGKLIVINKEEATELRRQIPSVHVHRTAKQRSKRHKYFVEESYKVLALLQKIRKED